MYLLESTKVPFILSRASSECTCAPLFAVHCPFPVSSLRASTHSQQCFFPPILLCSDWNLCLAVDYYLCSLYIWHEQNVFQADHYFIPLHLDMYLKDQPFILWHNTGLGIFPLLSSGMWNYRLASQ